MFFRFILSALNCNASVLTSIQQKGLKRVERCSDFEKKIEFDTQEDSGDSGYSGYLGCSELEEAEENPQSEGIIF